MPQATVLHIHQITDLAFNEFPSSSILAFIKATLLSIPFFIETRTTNPVIMKPIVIHNTKSTFCNSLPFIPLYSTQLPRFYNKEFNKIGINPSWINASELQFPLFHCQIPLLFKINLHRTFYNSSIFVFFIFECSYIDKITVLQFY